MTTILWKTTVSYISVATLLCTTLYKCLCPSTAFPFLDQQALDRFNNLNTVNLLFVTLCCSGIVDAKQVNAKDYGSWSLLCGDKGNCILSQLVAKDKEAKQVMLGASVSYALSNSYPILMLRMPPQVREKSGIGIKIDDNDAIQLPMSECNAVACQSVIKIDRQLLSEMRHGHVAQIAYAIEGQQIVLPLSLDGFAAAYTALNNQML